MTQPQKQQVLQGWDLVFLPSCVEKERPAKIASLRKNSVFRVAGPSRLFEQQFGLGDRCLSHMPTIVAQLTWMFYVFLEPHIIATIDWVPVSKPGT